MKLNPDCIRDILLDVEQFVTYSRPYDYLEDSQEDNSFVAKYDEDTVLYHIRQCEETGYLLDVRWTVVGNCLIGDLSPDGHQFLADIREDTNWNKTKEIAKKVGSSSLSALKDIATSVISSLIQKSF